MENKKCSGCYTEKPLSDFYDKKRSKVRKDGSVHTWVGKYAKCKKCVDEINNIKRPLYNDYYVDYRKKNKAKIAVKTRKHYINNNLNWIELIATEKDLVCEKCGYDKTWAGLDFHHKDPREKETTVHQLMKSSVPTEEKWEKMKQELAKCVVLCATCHREEHMKYDYFNMLAEKFAKNMKEKKDA